MAVAKGEKPPRGIPPIAVVGGGMSAAACSSNPGTVPASNIAVACTGPGSGPSAIPCATSTMEESLEPSDDEAVPVPPVLPSVTHPPQQPVDERIEPMPAPTSALVSDVRRRPVSMLMNAHCMLIALSLLLNCLDSPLLLPTLCPPMRVYKFRRFFTNSTV